MNFYIAIPFISCVCAVGGNAQVQYSQQEYHHYQNWLYQYSQTPNFDEDGASLLAFIDQTPVHESPNTHSPLNGYLGLGERVINQLIVETEKQYTTIDGYREQWYRVQACRADGSKYRGYVWGGYLAKSWVFNNIDDDNNHELILLGLSRQKRKSEAMIQGELRVVKKGKLLNYARIDGLCLFDDCNANSLVRVFKTHGQVVIETSTITDGCLSGVDKTLFNWNKYQLELVYQAEYATGYQYVSRPFYLQEQTVTKLCYYQSESAAFDPVWACSDISTTVAVP